MAPCWVTPLCPLYQPICPNRAKAPSPGSDEAISWDQGLTKPVAQRVKAVGLLEPRRSGARRAIISSRFTPAAANAANLSATPPGRSSMATAHVSVRLTLSFIALLWLVVVASLLKLFHTNRGFAM